MVRFGTCSWKYDSWTGIVYSGFEENHLIGYSKSFNTVEVDQWFWSLFNDAPPKLPAAATVKEYAESVDQNFRFTIKAPNSLTLTHYYNRSGSKELTVNPYFLSPELNEKFFRSIDPLGEKAGVIIYQFEYLNKQKMRSQEEFQALVYEFVKNIDRRYKIGIEIRNPNYLNRRFFDFLAGEKIIPVFLEGYYMPPVTEYIYNYLPGIETDIVLRLHGPDRSGIEQKTNNIWNTIVEPKDSVIAQLVRLLRFLKERETDIYVNVNNHFEGSAPLTIQKIKENMEAE
ncbi:MAG: DUF72 domain-containing protein [Ignavibacteriaceae bacterium]|nr:DUF72 domain-containing protein [Ignavibacteriaceae bacterium]